MQYDFFIKKWDKKMQMYKTLINNKNSLLQDFEFLNYWCEMETNMGIEERIERLEQLTEQMEDRINYLESKNNDKWVSAKELAQIMGCSVNNVYIKIRAGEIYSTNKLGSIQRIPMSQFYKNESVKSEPKNSNENLTIKKKVFDFV